MKSPFLLWINAVVFCVYLAAHLFDIFILVPNWRGGSLEELRTYNAFFHAADPRHFFSFIRPFSIIISALCLVVYWSRGGPMRVLLVISMMIDVLIYVVTEFYFSPINDYLFLGESEFIDPQTVKAYARNWIAYNYIRIALVTVGVYSSLGAVHFAYKRR